jgi:hypothetical protein
MENQFAIIDSRIYRGVAARDLQGIGNDFPRDFGEERERGRQGAGRWRGRGRGGREAVLQQIRQ